MPAVSLPLCDQDEPVGLHRSPGSQSAGGAGRAGLAGATAVAEPGAKVWEELVEFLSLFLHLREQCFSTFYLFFSYHCLHWGKVD